MGILTLPDRLITEILSETDETNVGKRAPSILHSLGVAVHPQTTAALGVLESSPIGVVRIRRIYTLAEVHRAVTAWVVTVCQCAEFTKISYAYGDVEMIVAT